MKNITKIIICLLSAVLGGVFGISLRQPLWICAVLALGFVMLIWIMLTLGGAITKTTKQMNDANKSQREEHHQEMLERKANAVAEYEKISNRVEEELRNAEKPEHCNTVRFIGKPFQFPNMKSYQYMADWEVWKKDRTLYFYQKAVEMYPEYSDMDAPEICSVQIEDIQYFKLEGQVETSTYVTGGRVKQDKRTGKVSQTALKNKTVKNDSRYVKLSVAVNGIIKTLEFNKESYDVFLLLISEKEYNKAIG